MQGLWSNHRKTKVNLNQIPPTSIPSQQDSPSKPARTRSQITTAEGENVGNIQEAPMDTPEALAPSGSSSAKRKLRAGKQATGDPPPKRQRPTTAASGRDYITPTTRLSDLGGVQPCVEKMLELVAMPLCHPEVYLHTGVQPPRGVLLHGPPGCGKTLLANAIAGVSSPQTSFFPGNEFVRLTRDH